MALLDDPGHVDAAGLGSFKYALTGGDDTVRHVVMQNSDGEALIALWRDVEVWDPVSLSRLHINTVNVRVHVPAQSASFDVFSPSEAESAVSHGSGTSIVVPLGGELKLVRVVDWSAEYPRGEDPNTAVKVSLTTSVSSVAARRPVRVEGTVVDASGRPVADGAIVLHAVALDGSGRPARDRARRTVGRTRTDSNGRWQITVTPSESAQFQAEWQAQANYKYGRSRPSRPVRVLS